MSNKTKTVSAIRQLGRGLLKRLSLAFLLVGLMIGLGVFTPQLALAQSQSEASDCYEKYSGKGGGITGDPIIASFLGSDCKYSGGSGNCKLFDLDAGKIIYCSTRANTEPVPVDPGINELDSCTKQEDLSFNWGASCVDSASLISIIFGLLASAVGIAVVIGITWGGMLYATSNGNSAKAQQGVTVIVNSVIGLLIFIFIFAITNFLVPGGIFRG